METTMIPRHLARAVQRMHQDPPAEVVNRLNRRYPQYAWRIGAVDGYAQAYSVRHDGQTVEYAYKVNNKTN